MCNIFHLFVYFSWICDDLGFLGIIEEDLMKMYEDDEEDDGRRRRNRRQISWCWLTVRYNGLS